MLLIKRNGFVLVYLSGGIGMIIRIFQCLLLVNFLLFNAQSYALASLDSAQLSEKKFQQLLNAEWNETFYDPCTKDWKENWFLDGTRARIANDEDGMSFWAGPTFKNDTCHAVLWTQQSFEGDLKIEYEYTRLDRETRCVTIIYIQASGTGSEPYYKDITSWNHLREIPSMRTYFDNMNTYHISYAAHKNDNLDPIKDYIRARRYMPDKKKGLKGTALKPDYFDTGLFIPGIPYQITIIKKGSHLYMQIESEDKKLLCHWKNDSFPPITEGRIGLRHMYTRGARYKDFTIYTNND